MNYLLRTLNEIDRVFAAASPYNKPQTKDADGLEFIDDELPDDELHELLSTCPTPNFPRENTGD